jgi:acetylornithine deacetylase/succinyl-diaminopimelate desuccinylase-like protein
MSELAGSFGPRVLQLADRLAKWSETPHGLTCTYLTPTHRSVAAATGVDERRLRRRWLAPSVNSVFPMAPSMETMRMPAVPCSERIIERFAEAVGRAGLPVVRLACGAGHDAVMFDRLTDLGMLFVRCGNDGISHSPLETVTADDVDVVARVLLDVLIHLDADGL